MYRLYYARHAIAMAPQVLLSELDVPHELIEVNIYGPETPDWYLKLNPNRRVPTLTYDDQVVWEAGAIMIHLCDRHPEKGMAPAPDDPMRARFYQWMFYMASTVHPFGKNYNYAHRYSTEAAHIPGIKAKALENLLEIYGRIEEALEPGPYVLGDRYSAADINFLVADIWRGLRETESGAPALECPNLRRLAALLRERPAVQTMLEIHGVS